MAGPGWWSSPVRRSSAFRPTSIVSLLTAQLASVVGMPAARLTQLLGAAPGTDAAPHRTAADARRRSDRPSARVLPGVATWPDRP